MKKYFLLGSLFMSLVLNAQTKTTPTVQTFDDLKAIQSILDNQISAWNKGDLTNFMTGYLNSDSLVFIGKSGPTYGYQNTLENYKKTYPDKTHMGILNFEIISMKPLGTHYYFVIGKWFLKRAVGDLNGVYTLVFKKTKEGWKIIADHSS